MGRRTACSGGVYLIVLVWALPLGSAGSAEVPFELHQQHLIVIRGSIGTLKGLNLLIDTGTIPSVVEQSVARKLRLATRDAMLVAFGQQLPIRSAVLDGFRIGPLSSGPVPVGVGDLSFVRGVRIDAIVGLDVLVRTNFAIDYRQRRLELAPAATGEAAAALDVTWPFVTVRVKAADYELRLLVDTGSRDLVVFAARAPAAQSAGCGRGTKTVHYASGPALLRRCDLRHASFAGEQWDTLPAWILDRALDGYPPEIDGVLGVMALGCARVRFDFDRGELGCLR